MGELILFGLTFLLVFLIYEFFLIGPRKKKNNKKKELLEIKYMQARYHIDFDSKIYPQLLQICAITSSFDMAIAVTIVAMIHSFFHPDCVRLG